MSTPKRPYGHFLSRQRLVRAIRPDLTARQARGSSCSLRDQVGGITVIERVLGPLALSGVLGAGLTASGLAQSHKPAPSEVFGWKTQLLPRDPAVRVGTLPNGMTYYVRRNGRPEKRVSLRLAVQAGSVLE